LCSYHDSPPRVRVILTRARRLKFCFILTMVITVGSLTTHDRRDPKTVHFFNSALIPVCPATPDAPPPALHPRLCLFDARRGSTLAPDGCAIACARRPGRPTQHMEVQALMKRF